MYKTKVFLKFNRIGEMEDKCLSFWLKLFDDYKIYIVCDLFNIQKDKIPINLVNLIKDQNVTFVNSNYSLGNEYVSYIKARKRNMASANLTCFEYINRQDKFFWVIDADDTHFINPDWKILKEKFYNAEKYLEKENLDAFSLDFYRNFNGTWTFGVCLINSKIEWKKIKNITSEDLQKFNLPGNNDSVFDVLGRMGELKLKNFVIDRSTFQHVYNNFKGLENGVYYWEDGKLYDRQLFEDVVIL
jgi:hypothetical protein